MAGKTKMTRQKEKVPEKEGPETPPDSPLLDLSDAAVKKLIRTAKKRGFGIFLPPCRYRSRRFHSPESVQRASYLKKSLDRNTTGPLASAGPSKNLRDARSSITSRRRAN
jgi:hypothetical protein